MGLIVGSITFSFGFCLLILEVIILFQVKGIENYDYGSQGDKKVRDKQLGAIFIRFLLVIGNLILLYSLLKS